MVTGPQSRVWSALNVRVKCISEAVRGASIECHLIQRPVRRTVKHLPTNPSTIQLIYRILVEMCNVQEKFYIERQVNMSIGNLQFRWNGETLILNSACSPEFVCNYWMISNNRKYNRVPSQLQQTLTNYRQSLAILNANDRSAQHDPRLQDSNIRPESPPAYEIPLSCPPISESPRKQFCPLRCCCCCWFFFFFF